MSGDGERTDPGETGGEDADHGDRQMASGPPRSSDLPAGYDEGDPYEEADLGTYPDWWRANVELFREHGLRPYRPPRFADGTLTTPVVEALASDLGVEVELRTVNPQRTATTEVLVDGERVVTAERSRESDGHTEYDLTADAFETAVRSAVGPERADEGSEPDG